MFRFMARLFPFKAESLDKFIYLAKAAKCNIVAVMPFKRCIGLGMPGAGFFTHYDAAVDDYCIRHIAETEGGERIVYKEQQFLRVVPLVDFSREEYERDDLALFFAAKKRVEDLQGEFSRVVVLLVDEKEKRFDEAACNERHRRAVELGGVPLS